MDKPKLIDMPIHGDDRGFVYCVIDQISDWKIKRAYVVENYARGQIRAWHGHKNGSTFIHVVRGAAKVAALYMGVGEKVLGLSHVISARKPQMLQVPPGWYNGHMSLEDNTQLLILSTLSFDEVKQDDERATYDYKVGKEFWEVCHR